MAKKLTLLTVLILAGTAVFAVLYRKTACQAYLPLVITFGTTAYHVVMRQLVALAFHTAMRNRADYGKRWYQVSKREMALYDRLRVKKWKRGMPTYDPTQFDPRRHTWEEIAAGARFGAYPVFIVTSVLAALFDMMLVMMQRYNRQRVMRLLERERAASR